MDTIFSINIDDIDTKFVENLKREYAHAAVEIRLQGQADLALTFKEADFWEVIAMLDWSMEREDEKVVEPLINFLSEQHIGHIYRFSDILSEKLERQTHFIGPGKRRQELCGF
jgi:hypothetical protein